MTCRCQYESHFKILYNIQVHTNCPLGCLYGFISLERTGVRNIEGILKLCFNRCVRKHLRLASKTCTLDDAYKYPFYAAMLPKKKKTGT